MGTNQETWSTDKSFDEVVELLPHLRALDIGTVWVESGPCERATSISPSRTIYNGVPIGVDVSVLIEDIDICWGVDIVNYGDGGGDDIDVDAASTLLQELPPKPRAAFTAILDGRMELLDQQIARASSGSAKMARLKDVLTRLSARRGS